MTLTHRIRSERRHRRLAAGIVAAAVAAPALLAAVAIGSPAAAAPQQQRSGEGTTTVSAVAKGGGGAMKNRQVTASYWTPQRMKAAVPLDAPKGSVPKARQSAAKATGKPGRIAPAATPASAKKALQKATGRLAAARSVNASATVGRVFFYNPNTKRNSSCSASAINSASKQLVLTAGHCVHGGKGKQYMQNWVFVPRYNYGSQPFGQFAAKYYITFDSWRNSTNFERDVAFVTTWPNSRGKVVNVVGGNGLSYNYSYTQFITILAYPADPPYDGGWQQYCQGNTRRVGWWPFQENRMEMRCGFTGGSSGSPWLRAYNNSTGLGYSNGVMSTLASGGWNRSPYFDTSVRNLYNLGASLT